MTIATGFSLWKIWLIGKQSSLVQKCKKRCNSTYNRHFEKFGLVLFYNSNKWLPTLESGWFQLGRIVSCETHFYTTFYILLTALFNFVLLLCSTFHAGKLNRAVTMNVSINTVNIKILFKMNTNNAAKFGFKMKYLDILKFTPFKIDYRKCTNWQIWIPWIWFNWETDQSMKSKQIWHLKDKPLVLIKQFKKLWIKVADNGFRIKSIDDYIGRIHLPHLRIHKYFMDESSINFHDKVFLHFLKKIWQKMKKTLFMEIYACVVTASKVLTDP